MDDTARILARKPADLGIFSQESVVRQILAILEHGDERDSLDAIIHLHASWVDWLLQEWVKAHHPSPPIRRPSWSAPNAPEVSLKPCPEEPEHLCCYPACNCAMQRLPSKQSVFSSTDTYISELENTIVELREAAQPFLACVFNDTGDVSISTGSLTAQDWLRLDRAVAGAETE